MRGENADSHDIVAESARADVVVLVEATRESLAPLRELGWEQRFPYSAGDPADDQTGTVIYSRYPLSDKTVLPRTSYSQRAATAHVPEIGPVRIIAVHPCNPFCGGRWTGEHEVIRSAVAANMALPLVVAGDFNAVHDHLPLRQLRRAGLHSATAITGAGWLPTYPANAAIPPTIPIDHILLNSRLTATFIATVAVPGTDHLGLVAGIAGTTRARPGPG